jgi:hypothetical protein
VVPPLPDESVTDEKTPLSWKVSWTWREWRISRVLVFVGDEIRYDGSAMGEASEDLEGGALGYEVR